MSGVIKFANGTADCLICDMSISGAAIEVTGPQVIPERFDLVFKKATIRHFHVTSFGGGPIGSG